jgi:hypothetical protein
MKTEAEKILLAKQISFVFQRHIGVEDTAKAFLCMSPSELLAIVKAEVIWPDNPETCKGLKQFFSDAFEVNFSWIELMDYSTRK